MFDKAWIKTLCVSMLAIAFSTQASALRLDGFNIIAVPGHPFGGTSAQTELEATKQLGATAVAIIPFLWQADTSSTKIIRGSDMSDDDLRKAIRQAHALGLYVIVKPHVWVPKSWAGAVEPKSEAAWQAWFADYRREIERIAKIAAAEGADALVIGTELTKTSKRPEWIGLIADIRSLFPRILIYVAHNIEEAEAVPFWNMLDVIGVSLYPPLGSDADRADRLETMRAITNRIEKLADQFGKPVLVAEIGLRSATGAAARPWESAEERMASADPALQAEVLGDWLTTLRAPKIEGILVWRWLTDPSAGGPDDTDFTVQGKPAEAVLECAWKSVCPPR
jgi:sugar phosphate isomerase/epimerase